jgi:hypothetical protein
LLALFAGRWAGAGTVELQGARREAFSCRASYASAGATGVDQTLRCANPRYTYALRSSLRLEGTNISGEWHDDSQARSGLVVGRVTSKALVLSLSGDGYEADMVVRLDACTQTIAVMSRTQEVERAELSLRKADCAAAR